MSFQWRVDWKSLKNMKTTDTILTPWELAYGIFVLGF